jgi:bifunctional non-homologous end joining protein LigD
MLATLVDAPFHRPGWIWEEKYDGIRLIAVKDGRRVRLLTRNDKDRTADFAGVAEALAALPAPTLVLDGEVVVYDAEGVSRFQLLQQRGGGGTSPIYVAFDCLHARGRELVSEPLTVRRAALETELREGPRLQLARRVAEDGFAAFAEARRRGLEGVIGKDPRSRYEPGVRSPAWCKVKVRAEEEFVIGGFTAPRGSRTHLGALLVGAWDEGGLRYAGKVGTGFTDKTLAALHRRLSPLARSTSAFVDAPRERDVTWVEPQLVAQLAFTELTGDGKLRHPVFLGLREDKDARDVRWPTPPSTPINRHETERTDQRGGTERSRSDRDQGTDATRSPRDIAAASERRLRRRNPDLGGGSDEHAQRARSVGRGAKPPSEATRRTSRERAPVPAAAIRRRRGASAPASRSRRRAPGP